MEAELKEFGESLGAPVDFPKKLAQYCNGHVLPTWRNPHIAASVAIFRILQHGATIMFCHVFNHPSWVRRVAEPHILSAECAIWAELEMTDSSKRQHSDA